MNAAPTPPPARSLRTPIVAIIIFAALCLYGMFHRPPQITAQTEIAYSTAPLTIATPRGQVTFTVEVAQTEPQITHGLMFRTSVPLSTGMIFDLGKSQHIDMWMKNTLVPLDMLFVDSHGTITQIAQSTTPLSTHLIPSMYDTRAVVELAGGVTGKLGIVKGDRVVFRPLFP